MPPWPAATLGEHYTPPDGRGYIRLFGDERTGRCGPCGRAWPRLARGKLTAHAVQDVRCPGSGQDPAEDAAAASWLPVLRGLTPQGLRHGLQTWMDEDGIPEVLKTQRMGHELPGMHGVYGHASPAVRADLRAALQERWEGSLRERAAQFTLDRPVAGSLAGWLRVTRGFHDPLPFCSQNRTCRSGSGGPKPGIIPATGPTGQTHLITTSYTGDKSVARERAACDTLIHIGDH